MANGNGQLGAVARGSQLAGGINGSPRVNALRAYANLQAKQRAAQAKLANVAQKRRLATPQLGAAPTGAPVMRPGASPPPVVPQASQFFPRVPQVAPQF